MPKKFPNDLFYYDANKKDSFALAKKHGQNFIKLNPGSKFEITYFSNTNQIELWCDKFSLLTDFPSLFGPGEVPGYLSQGDIDAIKVLSDFLPDEGMIIEIGCFLGKSSVEWAKNLQDKNYEIVCVDSFNSNIEYLKLLIKDADFDEPPGNTQLEVFKFYTTPYKNIKPLELFFNNNFEGEKDLKLVFEDSDHSFDAVLRSLPFWYDKLDKDGILCGHDYADDVKAAVDLFALQHNLVVHTFDLSSIWYIFKQ